MDNGLPFTNFEQAEMDYWKFMFPPGNLASAALGARCSRMGKAFLGAIPQADILAFNRVLGAGLSTPLDQYVLADIVDWYRRQNVKRFFLPFSPFLHTQDQISVLEQSGFRFYNNWVKLYRALDQEPDVVHSPLQIKTVTPNEAVLFGEIVARSFGWPADLSGIFSSIVGQPGWIHYIAWENKEPAGCAAMYISGKMASFAIAATCEEKRNKGAQSLLIRQRLKDAKNAGCDYVVVETAEEKKDHPSTSFRNLIRFGFRPAYLRPNYIFYT